MVHISQVSALLSGCENTFMHMVKTNVVSENPESFGKIKRRGKMKNSLFVAICFWVFFMKRALQKALTIFLSFTLMGTSPHIVR